jgi:hypothetical protein
MKIQRGKIAILLVVLVMIVPAGVITVKLLHERATSACIATPTSEPDSQGHIEFTWSPLGWVCYKTFVDKLGHPLGKTLKTQLPLVP